MAIPISEYIHINENVVNASGGFNPTSLIITAEDMIVTGDMKTAFDNGEVVTVSTVIARMLFDSTSQVAKMLNAYGAYKIKLFKADGSYKDAFDDVLNKDGGFGAFATDGAFDADIASANDTESAQHMYVAPTKDNSATNKYLLKIYAGEDNSDLEQIGAVLGWAANIDHLARNGASTLMYKDLGVDATVQTLVKKESLDELKISYCGLVQYHGATRKFFQMGKCADGTDAGVVMSAIYMNAAIENGWIDLAMGSNKIPANAGGAAMVIGLVTDVAENAVTNGAILCDKPLTSSQIQSVYQYTGNTGAVDAIQSVGYYVSASIKVIEGEYICEYTLVYAKGDHIAKVGGSHVLA